MKVRRVVLPVFRVLSRLLARLGFGRLPGVRVTYKLAASWLKDPHVIVSVAGNRLILDRFDSLELSIWESYGPLLTSVIGRELKEGDVAIDIGANIGTYTLVCAGRVGALGKVYAFEPDPQNFHLLQRNIELNRYRNVVPVQKAVTQETGEALLYLSDSDTGDHRVYDSHEDREFIRIDGIRLDDYFQGYAGKVDFIKLDIQGSEAEALQGARTLIEKNLNLKIVTEYWPKGLEACGTKPEDFLRLLSDWGFSLHEIREARGTVEPAKIRDLLMRFPAEGGRFTNLLCTRGGPQPRVA